MNAKEISLTIGWSALIIGILYGVALSAVLLVNATADERDLYVPEFQNCYISEDGHEMCK